MSEEIKQEETVIEEASRLIFGDRRAAYGDVYESFNKVAVGWEVLFGVPITPEQVSMAMVWLKLCREANKPGRDNVVDLIGYAALIDEIKKAKNK